MRVFRPDSDEWVEVGELFGPYRAGLDSWLSPVGLTVGSVGGGRALSARALVQRVWSAALVLHDGPGELWDLGGGVGLPADFREVFDGMLGDWWGLLGAEVDLGVWGEALLELDEWLSETSSVWVLAVSELLGERFWGRRSDEETWLLALGLLSALLVPDWLHVVDPAVDSDAGVTDAPFWGVVAGWLVDDVRDARSGAPLDEVRGRCVADGAVLAGVIRRLADLGPPEPGAGMVWGEEPWPSGPAADTSVGEPVERSWLREESSPTPVVSGGPTVGAGAGSGGPAVGVGRSVSRIRAAVAGRGLDPDLCLPSSRGPGRVAEVEAELGFGLPEGLRDFYLAADGVAGLIEGTAAEVMDAPWTRTGGRLVTPGGVVSAFGGSLPVRLDDLPKLCDIAARYFSAAVAADGASIAHYKEGLLAGSIRRPGRDPVPTVLFAVDVLLVRGLGLFPGGSPVLELGVSSPWGNWQAASSLGELLEARAGVFEAEKTRWIHAPEFDIWFVGVKPRDIPQPLSEDSVNGLNRHRN